MKEKFILSLNFTSSTGSTEKIIIAKPLKNLSSELVAKTMDQIIQCGVLKNVSSKKSAEYVTYSMEQVQTH